jgi:hypothetical protein
MFLESSAVNLCIIEREEVSKVQRSKFKAASSLVSGEKRGDSIPGVFQQKRVPERPVH